MSSTEIVVGASTMPDTTIIIVSGHFRSCGLDSIARTLKKDTIGKDSVPIPRRQLINAIRAKDSLDIMKAEVSEKDKEIETLYTGKSLDSLLVIQLNTTIADGESYSTTLEKEKENLLKQNQLLTSLNTNYKSDLKKAKRAIIKTAGISSLIISGLTYLIVHAALKHN